MKKIEITDDGYAFEFMIAEFDGGHPAAIYRLKGALDALDAECPRLAAARVTSLATDLFGRSCEYIDESLSCGTRHVVLRYADATARADAMVSLVKAGVDVEDAAVVSGAKIAWVDTAHGPTLVPIREPATTGARAALLERLRTEFREAEAWELCKARAMPTSADDAQQSVRHRTLHDAVGVQAHRDAGVIAGEKGVVGEIEAQLAAALAENERLARERDEALAAVDCVREQGEATAHRLHECRNAAVAELGAVRAMTEGRTVPPTDREAEALEAEGGFWRCVVTINGEVSHGLSFDLSRTPSSSALVGVPRRRGSVYVETWWAQDAKGCLRAWPVVEEAPHASTTPR